MSPKIMSLAHLLNFFSNKVNTNNVNINKGRKIKYLN